MNYEQLENILGDRPISDQAVLTGQAGRQGGREGAGMLWRAGRVGEGRGRVGHVENDSTTRSISNMKESEEDTINLEEGMRSARKWKQRVDNASLGRLIFDARVSALGEVGLDYSMAPGTWSAQLSWERSVPRQGLNPTYPRGEGDSNLRWTFPRL